MLLIPSVLVYFYKSEVLRGNRGSVCKYFIVRTSTLAILEGKIEKYKE